MRPRALRSAAVAMALVIGWSLVARLVHSPLLPSPANVGAALLAALIDGSLPIGVATTLGRLVVGFGIAFVLGVPAGIALARSRVVKELAGPLVLGLSSVPSICWLPLGVLWFGLSEKAIQSVVVLGAVLPIAMATESAVRHSSPPMERAARTLGARGAWLLWSVTLPAALPGILAGAKVGWSFALRALMAAELLFVSGGLGQLLETGRDLGDTSLVLGIVVVVVALGRAVDWALFARIERSVARRWGVAT